MNIHLLWKMAPENMLEHHLAEKSLDYIVSGVPTGKHGDRTTRRQTGRRTQNLVRDSRKDLRHRWRSDGWKPTTNSVAYYFYTPLIFNTTYVALHGVLLLFLQVNRYSDTSTYLRTYRIRDWRSDDAHAAHTLGSVFEARCVRCIALFCFCAWFDCIYSPVDFCVKREI